LQKEYKYRTAIQYYPSLQGSYLQLRMGTKGRCLYLKGWLALIGQWRFRLCHCTEWCGAAWNWGIANGVIVTWNFYNIL